MVISTPCVRLFLLPLPLEEEEEGKNCDCWRRACSELVGLASIDSAASRSAEDMVAEAFCAVGLKEAFLS